MTRARKSQQQGMALVVGLILLALMTLMIIASFNMGRTSLDIVGNMQRRAEVVAAANSVIQEAMSTTKLFETPGAVFPGNTRTFDINGDGTDDVTVVLDPPPGCVKNQVIPNGRLRYDRETDVSCATESSQMHGVAGVPTGSSKCADSMWEIIAAATDDVTGAQVTVTAGAAVRVAADDIGVSCP